MVSFDEYYLKSEFKAFIECHYFLKIEDFVKTIRTEVVGIKIHSSVCLIAFAQIAMGLDK